MTIYLYPEEWTGRRAREVHTLATCIALARAGGSVTLVAAGGEPALRRHLDGITGGQPVPRLELAFVPRRIGPVRSAGVFGFHLKHWLRARPPVAGGFAIHLKAAGLLSRFKIPYLFEVHEIFAETRQRTDAAQRALEKIERAALVQATIRVATSSALAGALAARYGLHQEFHVIPNAGDPPLRAGVARADGPFVYLGSIADWKGLDLILAAARGAGVPLRVVGGSEQEWRAVAARNDVSGVEWRPRVPPPEIPQALTGARAGLIATQPESGSGRYSCPMKLFDYARCGLPVISTDLPSLADLDPGPWCMRVARPEIGSWTSALRDFRFDAGAADDALAWAAQHTWAARGEALHRLLPRS